MGMAHHSSSDTHVGIEYDYRIRWNATPHLHLTQDMAGGQGKEMEEKHTPWLSLREKRMAHSLPHMVEKHAAGGEEPRGTLKGALSHTKGQGNACLYNSAKGQVCHALRKKKERVSQYRQQEEEGRGAC